MLADYARAHNWRVEADLNNDIVGNSEAANGVHDATHVRVFSEGTRAMETTEEANRRRYNGGEVDSPIAQSGALHRRASPIAISPISTCG